MIERVFMRKNKFKPSPEYLVDLVLPSAITPALIVRFDDNDPPPEPEPPPPPYPGDNPPIDYPTLPPVIGPGGPG